MKNPIFVLRNTLSLLLLAAFGTALSAQTSTLSIQGVLRKADGNAVADGQQSLTFKLWDAATGGTEIYSETQTDVQVTGGIYSTLLGRTKTLNAPFDKTYYLGVTVGTGQELIPRAQLSSAPYTLAIKGQSNVVPSNGNVGVGTLSPSTTAKLEVSNGTTGLQVQPGRLDGTANNEWTTLEMAGLKNLRVQDNFSVSDKVAIGSTTFAQDAGLFVNSSIRVKDDASIYGLNQLVGFNDLWLHGDPTGGPDLSIHENGNVGIGLTPGQLNGDSKLQVDGNIRVKDDANIYGLNQLVGFNDLRLSGDPTGGPDLIINSDGRIGVNTTSSNVRVLVAERTGDEFLFAGRNINGATIFYIHRGGELWVSGAVRGATKNFVIDHPLDPANKVLTHTSVESPDAYNLYQGMAVLDANGEAQVELPDYYEALNMDSRYQLTCVGGWAQVYISEEVKNNRFRIAGGKPGMKVSWQVTGTRHDPWMRDNRPATERLKTGDEADTYFYPKGYGQPDEKSYGRKGNVAISAQPSSKQ